MREQICTSVIWREEKEIVNCKSKSQVQMRPSYSYDAPSKPLNARREINRLAKAYRGKRSIIIDDGPLSAAIYKHIRENQPINM